MELLIVISILALICCAMAACYWFILAIASLRKPLPSAYTETEKLHRFALTIPAHDEENVIAVTVERLKNLNYPAEYYDVHIVADHCSDRTAEFAVAAGAFAHERSDGPRSGKGAALNWLFQRLLNDEKIDAIVVFDADTLVEPDFLVIMNTRLNLGARVIQGQHVISNPESGMFAALTWAMFLIDNRFQNLGRVNLGWSAKHMGDSICFRTDVLRNLGWGHGLTEDFILRQKLLLEGIKIEYEPQAKGYGEAPSSFAQAHKQRMRWLRGVQESSRENADLLLRGWIKTREGSLLDGVLQSRLPSYSTLTLLSFVILCCQTAVNVIIGNLFPTWLNLSWLVLAGLLLLYPFFGLAIEKAPARAYLAILSGPFFILWRTWLAVRVRFIEKNITWVRTAHGGSR